MNIIEHLSRKPFKKPFGLSSLLLLSKNSFQVIAQQKRNNKNNQNYLTA